MSHEKCPNSNSRDYQVEEDEINLLDLLLVLLRRKTMIFGFCLAAFALASGVALLMPDIYPAPDLWVR
jgi:uncharacterized protein involved in exopolysaccharide biosynthesis